MRYLSLFCVLGTVVGAIGLVVALTLPVELSRRWRIIWPLLLIAFTAPIVARDFLDFDAYSRRSALFLALTELRRDHPECLAGGPCPIELLQNEIIPVARFAVAGQVHDGRSLGNSVEIPNDLRELSTHGAMVVASVGSNLTTDLWLVTRDSVSLLTHKDQVRNLP
jgi:hypothetical protein